MFPAQLPLVIALTAALVAPAGAAAHAPRRLRASFFHESEEALHGNGGNRLARGPGNDFAREMGVTEAQASMWNTASSGAMRMQSFKVRNTCHWNKCSQCQGDDECGWCWDNGGSCVPNAGGRCMTWATQ